METQLERHDFHGRADEDVGAPASGMETLTYSGSSASLTACNKSGIEYGFCK